MNVSPGSDRSDQAGGSTDSELLRLRILDKALDNLAAIVGALLAVILIAAGVAWASTPAAPSPTLAEQPADDAEPSLATDGGFRP